MIKKEIIIIPLLLLLISAVVFSVNARSVFADSPPPVDMDPLSVTHQPNDFSGGTVTLNWSGTANVANILDISNKTYRIHFTLPEELRYLMSDQTTFKNHITASYQYPNISLLGLITGYGTKTVDSGDIQLDQSSGDISFPVSYDFIGLLNLLGTINVSHTLTLYLGQMGVEKLPPNPDKKLTFTSSVLGASSSVVLPTWYRTLGIHLKDPSEDENGLITIPVGNDGQPFEPLSDVKVTDEETGEIIPDATVTVTKDEMNSGDNLWLAGDYQLTYHAVDSYGISADRTVTVRTVPGDLSFASVPDTITFANTVISSAVQHIQRNSTADLSISIQDLRGQPDGKWSLWVSATPLTNGDGKTLQSGTLSVYGRSE
ncbi:hypothetical protein QS257_15840 [Terrilactibacillus sp. S3-3]|nr:hypothetical protein QS257_15840 [Terrilactibacillus sp. S3-3]